MVAPNDSSTSKPTPDPTVLTTEQLERAILNLKELEEAKLFGIKSTVDERFESVTTQFQLVERQRLEQKSDTKAAVDAALAAAKEAVKEQTTAFGLATTKSETATAEQLKQLIVTFNTAIAGLNSSLNDLKTRIERIENVKAGGKEQLSSIYAFVGFLISLFVLGGILAAAGVFNK